MSDPITLTLVGSALSGAAAGWSENKARKDAEKAELAKEKRQQASYEGLGKSSRYWEQDQDTSSSSTAAQYGKAPALGKRPDQVGSKYAVTPSTQLPKSSKPRWRFDPQSGQIQKG